MHTKARKVMIIGAGNVGASAAYALLNQSICEELILVDLNQQRAEAHAQDLSDAAAYLPGMMTISTREASDCADVDIAVITVSGGALRPGQSRLDELTSTAKIVKSIVPTMMANGFNGIFLVATNPCDIITWQVWQLSGLPRSQVLGTGVWLDTTRLRRLLAQELEIGAQSIDAFILGEHGDTQFPVWSHSSVYGTPIADLYQQRTGLPLDREAMADKVRKLGFEIYAGKGCTEYGVAGTIAEICRNIFTGSHRALAVSCILDGEYGVSGAAAGVPAVLAQGGVKQIIELQLAGEEQAKFSQSIAVIKANIARLPWRQPASQSAMISCGERVSSASRVLSGRWASVTISVNDASGAMLNSDQAPYLELSASRIRRRALAIRSRFRAAFSSVGAVIPFSRSQPLQLTKARSGQMVCSRRRP
ncbi:L-lactate dehydrogenase [Klebsiella pneumoniae BWH 47]|nr:L-lactate dehydrogenase [Klebsiella pneumoniae BWH 47]